MLDKIILKVLLLTLLFCGCVTKKTRIFSNAKLDSIVINDIENLKRFDDNNKVLITKNADTLIILNFKNIGLMYGTEKCSKYKEYEIIVRDQENSKLLRLLNETECPLAETKFSYSINDSLYGSIYLLTTSSIEKNKLIAKGDLKTLAPYLKSLTIKRVKIEEPKNKVAIPSQN